MKRWCGGVRVSPKLNSVCPAQPGLVLPGMGTVIGAKCWHMVPQHRGTKDQNPFALKQLPPGAAHENKC